MVVLVILRAKHLFPQSARQEWFDFLHYSINRQLFYGLINGWPQCVAVQWVSKCFYWQASRKHRLALAYTVEEDCMLKQCLLMNSETPVQQSEHPSRSLTVTVVVIECDHQ